MNVGTSRKLIQYLKIEYGDLCLLYTLVHYDPCFISVVSPTRKKRNPAVWDSQTRSSLFPKAKVKLYSDKCGKSLFQESFLLVSFIDNMLVYFYPLSMRKSTPRSILLDVLSISTTCNEYKVSSCNSKLSLFFQYLNVIVFELNSFLFLVHKCRN